MNLLVGVNLLGERMSRFIAVVGLLLAFVWCCSFLTGRFVIGPFVRGGYHHKRPFTFSLPFPFLDTKTPRPLRRAHPIPVPLPGQAVHEHRLLTLSKFKCVLFILIPSLHSPSHPIYFTLPRRPIK